MTSGLSRLWIVPGPSHFDSLLSLAYRLSPRAWHLEAFGVLLPDLCGRDEEVNDGEVSLKPVADEDAAAVNEVAKFKVRRAVMHKVVPAAVHVEVLRHLFHRPRRRRSKNTPQNRE